MPKVKAKVAGHGQINKTVKFRIGNRKSAKGAHQMTTADLIDTYGHDTSTRHKSKISTVLAGRGVDINTIMAERVAAEAAVKEAEVVEETTAE